MIDWIIENWGWSRNEAKLLVSGLVILALVVARWVVLQSVRRRIEDPSIWYRTRKIASYVVGLVGLLVLARLWAEGGGYGTYIGLLSAGLAIALSDVIKNLAGWLFIFLRRPFRIGDRIEIAGRVGDVVDVRAFRFSMLEVGNWVHADQSTGRIMHVPNGLIFTEPVANYTEGFEFIWHEVSVLVTFESDWEAAERIVLAAMEEHAPHHDPQRAGQELRRTAESYQITYRHLTPAVYLTVRDSGVLLTGRLLCEVRRRRAVENAVWKSILRAIAADPNVELAYPTVRTYLPDPVRVENPEAPPRGLRSKAPPAGR